MHFKIKCWFFIKIKKLNLWFFFLLLNWNLNYRDNLEFFIPVLLNILHLKYACISKDKVVHAARTAIKKSAYEFY